MRQHLNKLEIHRQTYKLTDLHTDIHLALCILATLCRVQDGQDSDLDNQNSHQGGHSSCQDGQNSQDSYQDSQCRIKSES